MQIYYFLRLLIDLYFIEITLEGCGVHLRIKRFNKIPPIYSKKYSFNKMGKYISSSYELLWEKQKKMDPIGCKNHIKWWYSCKIYDKKN